MSIKQYVVEAAKDSPVIGFLYAWWAGMDLNKATITAGFVYAIARLAWFGVECYWKWKDRRSGKQASE